MRAQAGRAEKARPEILLPSGQPSNPVGQGRGVTHRILRWLSPSPERRPCGDWRGEESLRAACFDSPTVSPAPPPAWVSPGRVQGRAWSPPGLLPFRVRAGHRAGTAPDPAPKPADLGSGAPSPDAPAARLPRRARGAPAHRAAPGGGGGGRRSRTRTGAPAPPARLPPASEGQTK